MENISIKTLLEAGVHFGHPARMWNPKMKPYIYGVRNKIHIIDLQNTLKLLQAACEFIKNSINEGKTLLFVSTKNQAKEIIKSEALRAQTYYVNERWLGGLITNFDTIKISINKLKELENLKNEGAFLKLTRKERNRKEKKLNKLSKYLEGIKNMEKIPDILYVVDPVNEKTAVLEANHKNIPVVALGDTDANPDLITYLIPGNDDAVRSIKLITSIITDSIIEAKQKIETIISETNSTETPKMSDVEKFLQESLEKSI